MKLDLFLAAEIAINPHMSHREIKHEIECLLDEPQSPMVILTLSVLRMRLGAIAGQMPTE